jgi:hypothetical protein
MKLIAPSVRHLRSFSATPAHTIDELELADQCRARRSLSIDAKLHAREESAAGRKLEAEVVVPDLRGMDLSSKPADGFEKRTQAGDVAGVLKTLKIGKIDLVTHDIGNMSASRSPRSTATG